MKFSPSCTRQKKKEVNTCRSSWPCVCSPWLHEMLAETPSCDCRCLNSPLGEQCTEFQHLTPKINYSGSRIGFTSTCTFRARSRLFLYFPFFFPGSFRALRLSQNAQMFVQPKGSKNLKCSCSLDDTSTELCK